MTKRELLSQLENAKNNYILGLAALALFATEDSYPLLEKASCGFGSYELSFAQVANLLRKHEDKQVAVREFMKMLLRALAKEAFELIKDYCDATNQGSSLIEQPWFHFARIIRNCLSHNFKFEFRKQDRKLLPVRWKNKSITAAMDGGYLELSFFGYVETWELFTEMDGFAKSTLN
jgi:hypothetical protein